MMLEWLGEARAAEAVRSAVERTLAAGHQTPDIGGTLTTAGMTAENRGAGRPPGEMTVPRGRQQMMRSSHRIWNVILVGAVGVLCAQSEATPQAMPADQAVHIQRLEAQAVDVALTPGEPPLRLSLEELIRLYRIPGLSIAVIDNFEIAWAKAYGVTDAGSNTPVTVRTLFQAGSISKPVAATGALSLVEAGKLSLDQDVNQALKTWKVPENEFTKTEKVTLRRLMSHTAGLTIHGFPGYDVGAPLPTVVQVLNGEEPANTAAVRVDTVPGTTERYSGGGVTIEQQLMTDVTGQPFPEFMKENVLDRIGMMDSSYLSRRQAAGPRAPLPERIRTGRPSTVGGTSTRRWLPRDCGRPRRTWRSSRSRIALSSRGKANHVLSEQMTKTMLTPVKDEAGLGVFLDRRNPGQFGHNGADEGFQALLTMNADTGKGVAIMANSDNGIAAAAFLVRAVAREYGWNYKSGPETFATLLLLAKARGPAAALDRYTELKKTGGADADIDEGTLNGLGYTLLRDGRARDAIAVFQRNVQEYPQSSNVYDSLGEAYMKDGQKDLAIANYERSLQLDPKNKNAIEMLQRLRGDK